MASTQSIIHSRVIEITDQEIERRKKFVGLEPVDIERIVSTKDVIVGKVEDLTNVFFAFLRGIEEAAPLFERADILAEAKRLKREHLIAMAQGKYDKAYVDQRLQLGLIYGKVALDVRVFLGAFHQLSQPRRRCTSVRRQFFVPVFLWGFDPDLFEHAVHALGLAPWNRNFVLESSL
jgi:Protoglobin